MVGTAQLRVVEPVLDAPPTQPNTANYTTLTQTERVISEHMVHQLNHDDSLQFYSTSAFRKAAITITSQQVMENIIPALQREVNRVIERRTASAKERAHLQYAEFGFKNPSEVDLAAEISMALVDTWFVKGPKHNIDPRQLHEQIQRCLDEGRPINMIANMLPAKNSSPLKTRGAMPDLSEVSILCRLAEITGIVNKLCEDHNREEIKAVFHITHDGTFFTDAVHCTEMSANNYKSNIAWWTQKLGFDDRITSHHYRDLLDNPAVAGVKQKFLETKQDARKVMDDLDPYFDPKNMEKTLSTLIDKDPYPDATNSDGRLVPLYKSIIYSLCDHPLLQEYAFRTGMNYDTLYRETTRDIFATYSKLNIADANAAIKNGIDSILKLSPRDAREALRIDMTQRVWEATKEYMALTAGHRELQEDLLTRIIGLDAIRFTVHPKPGQIGLALGDKGDNTLAWHGVGILRRSRTALRIGCEPRLQAEGQKGIPILIARDFDISPTPINGLAHTYQPFAYLTRDAADTFGIHTPQAFVQKFGELLKRTL